jgi:hypothetical protein
MTRLAWSGAPALEHLLLDTPFLREAEFAGCNALRDGALRTLCDGAPPPGGLPGYVPGGQPAGGCPRLRCASHPFPLESSTTATSCRIQAEHGHAAYGLTLQLSACNAPNSAHGWSVHITDLDCARGAPQGAAAAQLRRAAPCAAEQRQPGAAELLRLPRPGQPHAELPCAAGAAGATPFHCCRMPGITPTSHAAFEYSMPA